MTTNTTPRNLADLKHQDWVIDLKPTDTPQEAAEEVLNQLFPDDRPVLVRQLFTEENIRIYEAYKEGGLDYLYIKKNLQ